MMKRLAILIAAESVKRCAKSPDLTADEAWGAFLTSASGGAWNQNDEIRTLRDPSKQEILDAVNAASLCSYAFVVFLGQAELGKDRLGFPELNLKLRNAEPISERQLVPKNDRSVIILDENNDSSLPIDFLDGKENNPRKSLSRQWYDESMRLSEKGCVRISASGLGISKGGAFSIPLLRASLAWAQREKGILDLPKAIERVSLLEGPPPLYRGGRRLRHFPFAVGCL